MKIEEAKKVCKTTINFLRCCIPEEEPDNIETAEAIETVLQELENYQIKELQVLNNKLDNISATELQKILQPYYIQKEKLERKDETINELKNKLDNSINKDKVKEVFNTKIYNTNYLAETDWTEHQREVDLRLAGLLKVILQELLEDR